MQCYRLVLINLFKLNTMDTTNAKTETRNFKLELELLRKDRKQQEDMLDPKFRSSKHDYIERIIMDIHESKR